MKNPNTRDVYSSHFTIINQWKQLNSTIAQQNEWFRTSNRESMSGFNIKCLFYTKQNFFTDVKFQNQCLSSRFIGNTHSYKWRRHAHIHMQNENIHKSFVYRNCVCKTYFTKTKKLFCDMCMLSWYLFWCNGVCVCAI